MKKIICVGVTVLGFAAIAWNGYCAGNLNGSAGAMPTFYDGELFTINFKELPAGGASANQQHNGSINVIYVSEVELPSGEEFVSVIDAIQGDGFNPLWEEVEITFSGSTPHQFFSDEEILEAADSGELTLTDTGELYRCSVVGFD